MEPRRYLSSDVYFDSPEWRVFDIWAVQQGYWPLEYILQRAHQDLDDGPF
jgi:hypothetical protein